MKIKSDAVDLRGLDSQQIQQRRAEEQQDPARQVRQAEEDTVQVGLSREIQGLAETRRQRVEELKELVRKGEYRPDSRDVASSVAATISEEVFFEGLFSRGE